MTLRLGVSLFTVLAATACGETTIDSGRLERDVKEDAEREGLVLDSVECPSPEVREGERFDCVVTVKGERRELEVVQRANEAVGYDLTPLLEFTAGSDEGGDRAAVRFVVDAVNRDVTALCDYAAPGYRRTLMRRPGRCAKAAAAEYRGPLRDYRVNVERDVARATGDGRSVTLERQPDGSWLVTAVSARR